MRIYTGRGDDGTTGLFFGGRVSKDNAAPEAYGAVDEAVSALGVARAAARGAGRGELADDLLRVQRELFVVAAELATAAENRHKLEDGVSRVLPDMVRRLEGAIDALAEEVGTPTEFVVPGGDPTAAALDLARSVVRRAERRAVTVAAAESSVVPYLNRLADYLYMLVRAAEDEWVPSREEDA